MGIFREIDELLLRCETDAVDLYAAAKSIELQYPMFTRCELAAIIADSAVLTGYQTLNRQPLEETCNSPRCKCRGRSD